MFRTFGGLFVSIVYSNCNIYPYNKMRAVHFWTFADYVCENKKEEWREKEYGGWGSEKKKK